MENITNDIAEEIVLKEAVVSVNEVLLNFRAAVQENKNQEDLLIDKQEPSSDEKILTLTK